VAVAAPSRGCDGDIGSAWYEVSRIVSREPFTPDFFVRGSTISSFRGILNEE